MAKIPKVGAKPQRTKTLRFEMLDPNTVEALIKGEDGDEKATPSLRKSILNLLDGNHTSVERLAFEEDPTQRNTYFSLYAPKLRLLPDELLKRIAIQDDLVAAIVATRSNQISAFGREQVDRFSTGFRIEPKPGILNAIKDEEQRAALLDKIDAVSRTLTSSGKTKGWQIDDQSGLAQTLGMLARDAVVVGRFATEVIWVEDPTTGEKKFHSFRAADAGTIYKASPQRTAAAKVREEAFTLLQELSGKKLVPERYANDEYTWVQVIQGRPFQAFTSDELIVENCYPVTDVMLGGYPLTPLDTVLAAVTTHINIVNHNKLYFQTGRAAKGMLIIKSADVDANVVKTVRQQFNASINSVTNSWRMPVFGIGPEDEISWQPIDSGGGRDMEFQYLSDQNARVIMSAFQMSPEELPGYAHLSRGTNNQALSESNNEYKLEAARDVGIRPLLARIQDFLNNRILPLMDPELAKVCWIRLVGLDADTPEKESIRLQQDSQIHMTTNEILERVEKDPLPRAYGGEFLLNPAWQASIDKYLMVGQICEYFFDQKGASKNPALQYIRDPFWFQFQQLQVEAQQMQAQAQQGAAGGGAPPPGGGGGQPPPQQPQDGGGGGQPPPDDGGGQQDPGAQQQDSQGPQDQQGGDLESGIDQLMSGMSKSEAQLPANKRRLLAQNRVAIDKWMKAWKADAESNIESILAEVGQALPKGTS